MTRTRRTSRSYSLPRAPHTRQSAAEDATSIGNVLVDLGYLSQPELSRVLSDQATQFEVLLGRLIIQAGLISEDQLSQALSVQAGLRSSEQFDRAMAQSQLAVSSAVHVTELAAAVRVKAAVGHSRGERPPVGGRRGGR